MSRNSPHRFGTRITGSIDVAALRESIASPGMDGRYWCSRGTVGTVDDQGEENFADSLAVWIGPEGVECDVILQPLGIRVTALWGDAGDVADISPIRPGDQVLVEFPDGNLMGGRITGIIHSRAAKQPMKSGTPVFDNQRRLIYARTVPIDIRASTKAQVLMEQDGTVTTAAKRINLGDHDVSEQNVLGTSYRQAEDTLFDTLQQGLTAMQSAAVGPLAVFQPGLAVCVSALAAFKSSAAAGNAFLSSTVYGK
jgi:hypothetical protein